MGSQLALWRVCGWGLHGDALKERKKTEHPKSEVWSMPLQQVHLIISSVCDGMSCNLIIMSHHSSSFSPGIKELMLLSAFLETALSHQQKASTPWVSG